MPKIFYSASVLIGTIIGAGMFGIPYAINKLGFWPGLILLIILGLCFMLLMLLYGEIVLRTKRKHRLIGYARIYLGKKGKIIATISTVIGLYAALLSYLIIGGRFAHLLLYPFFGGTIITYTLFFFAIGALIVFYGIKMVARGELIMTLFLLIIISALFIKAMPFIQTANLSGMNLTKAFIPYGVILFALSGLAAIPEIPELLKNKKDLKKIIIISSLITILIYSLFALLTIGVCGSATSPDAFSGLHHIIPDHILQTGTLFGLLAVFTSLLVISLNLLNNFHYDYKMPHTIAFVLVFGIPLVVFLLGLRNFIAIIGTAGALLTGLNAIIIVLAHQKAKTKGKRKPEYSLKPPKLILWILSLIFIIGIGYKIWQLIS